MDLNYTQLDFLIKTMPSGIAKLAYDEVLSIIYATDSFYSLVQNATEKLNPGSSLALLRMVYSADIIYVTQQLASQKNRKDKMISVHFRTLQHDGSFKWVLVSGSRTDEFHQSGSKMVPVYSCVAVDVTDIMMKYKKLEQNYDYQRTITELSKELYFEYEIAKDFLNFTELFREVFGKDAQIPGFRGKLEKTKIIHPEELPAIIRIFNSMMSGKKQVRFETRLIPKDGVPCLYTCYASIIYDENRNPYKVVGKLALANPLKRDKTENVPAPSTKLDLLTGVYTKESTEIMVLDAISKLKEDALGSMLILDNYKSVNDLLEPMNGINVLTKISDIIKSHLRTTDIVGRTGLTEFVIYLKDLHSDKVIYELAEMICEEVNNLFHYPHLKSGLAIHIGIAFHKGKTQYQTLLGNANTALVMAKKSDVSSFEVFYKL